MAQRRDSHATMSAEGPEELRERIAADYAAHPVYRQGVGLGRPETPGCRFLPEG